MLRYLGLSSVIVGTFILAALALPHRSVSQGPQERYAGPSGTPGPPQNDSRSAAPRRMSGTASWALSALPECFHETSRTSGLPQFAHHRIPPAAQRVSAGQQLRVADCTLDVGPDTAVVVRGDDRLTVPAVARFYWDGPLLILDRITAGREDVRLYALRASPAKP